MEMDNFSAGKSFNAGGSDWNEQQGADGRRKKTGNERKSEWVGR